jgi:hypothetical protein
MQAVAMSPPFPVEALIHFFAHAALLAVVYLNQKSSVAPLLAPMPNAAWMNPSVPPVRSQCAAPLGENVPPMT